MNQLHLTVPDPGPPGPYGTMAWLRATVSRFANGETHARRRAVTEARLAALDPAELAAAASRALREEAPRREATRHDTTHSTTAQAEDERDEATPRGDAATFVGVPRAYLPVAVLAAATGVTDPVAATHHTRVVAAAYHPGTAQPEADEALRALLALLPPDEPERLAQHVAVLVQACEATAGLVRGENVPVKSTKRVMPDGTIIAVDLQHHPFGHDPRRCPGEAHARALAEALR